MMIIGLLCIIAFQWVLIWKLLDRLLMQANIPKLGPVVSRPPATIPTPADDKKKLFSVRIPT